MKSAELLKKITSTPPAQTVVVLDLDSTLYNVGSRTQAIGEAFCKEPQFLDKYPEECEQLKNLKVTSKHWGISDGIEELGIRSEITFFRDIAQYWRKKFFISDFLKYDTPSKGSHEFVNELLKNKITINYLTGRNKENMFHGTVDGLKKDGFPLNDQHELHMKPTQGMSDSKYKRDIIIDINKKFEHIWLIDNEPAILIELINSCPYVNCVFFDTVHSKRAEPPENILTLDGDFT